jgi:hypothetical protein
MFYRRALRQRETRDELAVLRVNAGCQRSDNALSINTHDGSTRSPSLTKSKHQRSQRSGSYVIFAPHRQDAARLGQSSAPLCPVQCRLRHKDWTGAICGHIHHPVIHARNGLAYVNCGDWVESCTAVVEQFDGRLEFVEWSIMEGRTEPNEAVGGAMTSGLAAE